MDSADSSGGDNEKTLGPLLLLFSFFCWMWHCRLGVALTRVLEDEENKRTRLGNLGLLFMIL
jgi:hypothetical protein